MPLAGRRAKGGGQRRKGMNMDTATEPAAAPVGSGEQIDTVRIGGDSDNPVTVRYEIGYTREGWGDAQPQAAGGVDRVLHIADVTMPALYCGSAQERDLWRRDTILEQYDLGVAC